MDALVTILFLILGLIFGSFFNVVGLRLPKNEPFANDRSACPHCHHALAWYELIPILSFLMQRGKCRHCKERISFAYPAVEVLTGSLFAFSYQMIGMQLELTVAILLMSMLVIIVVSDLYYMIIPNKVILFFLPLFLVLRFMGSPESIWNSLLGGLVGFMIIAIVITLSRGGMGAGDMKLFGVIGIVLGIRHVVLAFFLACLIGAVIGMLLLLSKRIERKQPVPFGPYIAAAAVIVYFYGDSLFIWYVDKFM